jgi:hypothetical protein
MPTTIEKKKSNKPKIIPGDAEFKSTFNSNDLTERAIYRRAIEAIIWGMPMVNYDLMYQAMMSNAKGRFKQIVYWSRLPNWKNQTLTPNPDSIYLMPFFNTKDTGPVVLEIPPADKGAIVGSVDDCWQTALEDVGPAGVDKGKGGKYLILTPGYKDQVAEGYIALACDIYQSYALLRTILKSMSDADVTAAVVYARGIKLYPLSQAANPPETVFVKESNWLPAPDKGGFKMALRLYAPKKNVIDGSWVPPAVKKAKN